MSEPLGGSGGMSPQNILKSRTWRARCWPGSQREKFEAVMKAGKLSCMPDSFGFAADYLSGQYWSGYWKKLNVILHYTEPMTNQQTLFTQSVLR